MLRRRTAVSPIDSIVSLAKRKTQRLNCELSFQLFFKYLFPIETRSFNLEMIGFTNDSNDMLNEFKYFSFVVLQDSKTNLHFLLFV